MYMHTVVCMCMWTVLVMSVSCEGVESIVYVYAHLYALGLGLHAWMHVYAWYLCMHTASLTTDWASLILLRSRSSVAWGSWLHGLYFSFLIPHVTAGNTALISKPWERIFNETNAHTAVLRYRCFLLVAIDFQLDILERQGVKRKWDTKEAGTVPSQPGPVQS